MEGRAHNLSHLWKLQIRQKAQKCLNTHITGDQQPADYYHLECWHSAKLLLYLYHLSWDCLMHTLTFIFQKNEECHKAREEEISMATLGRQGQQGRLSPSLGHWCRLQVENRGRMKERGWIHKQPWPSWGLAGHYLTDFWKMLPSKPLTLKKTTGFQGISGPE